MIKYVAMLRGIGPGNPNMTKLKFTSFFEELGFEGVQVVLASGNVIFESPINDKNALTETIEKALPEKLGFSRSVIIRSESELRNLIAQDPFRELEKEHNKQVYLLVTFFKSTPDTMPDLPYTPIGKHFTILGKFEDVIYGSVDLSEVRTPDYMVWLEKQFGKEITSRTPKTIRLILSRMSTS